MKKRGGILILCVLVLLAACIGLLAWLNAPSGEAASGTLTVCRDGAVLAVFTLDELRDMEAVEAEKEIVSASHADDSGLFRGVALRDILIAADSGIEQEATQIAARAQDGFVTVYSAVEVFDDPSIFVAYAQDGKDLGTLADGGTGPLRIILINDPFGNRSTKYLYELEVR